MTVNGILKRFTIRDLVLSASMAALGLAIKPVAVPLAHMISGPLMIPGGSLAGGLYMMWLVVAFGLTGKRGTATLTGLVQAIIVIIVGMNGSHGIMSLFSYTLPGAAADLLLLVIRRKVDSSATAFLAGIAANVTGTLCVNAIFFSLPLMLSVCVAAVSGGVGGLLAWALLKSLRKYGICAYE